MHLNKFSCQIISLPTAPECFPWSRDIVRVVAVTAVGALKTRGGIWSLLFVRTNLLFLSDMVLLYLLRLLPRLLLLLLLDCCPWLVDKWLDWLGVHHAALLGVGGAGRAVQGHGLQLRLLKRPPALLGRRHGLGRWGCHHGGWLHVARGWLDHGGSLLALRH